MSSAESYLRGWYLIRATSSKVIVFESKTFLVESPMPTEYLAITILESSRGFVAQENPADCAENEVGPKSVGVIHCEKATHEVLIARLLRVDGSGKPIYSYTGLSRHTTLKSAQEALSQGKIVLELKC
jgi:hypothetical protein